MKRDRLDRLIAEIAGTRKPEDARLGHGGVLEIVEAMIVAAAGERNASAVAWLAIARAATLAACEIVDERGFDEPDDQEAPPQDDFLGVLEEVLGPRGGR